LISVNIKYFDKKLNITERSIGSYTTTVAIELLESAQLLNFPAKAHLSPIFK
jgi:hypothetical protein